MTKTPLTMTAAEIASLKAEYKGLRGYDKATLVQVLRQSERIVDTSEMTKMDLVYRILRRRHGQERLVLAGLASA